jgi:pimeloyl-ACP methyl ester carboxylesterase
VIDDSLRGAPQAKAAWPNIAMSEDITEEVASINVPTVVISGELDQVDSIATLQAELLPRIPHAVMQVIPSTGHLSPLEAPEEVAQIIAGFVKAVVGKLVV